MQKKYQPFYENSHCLAIGINKYEHLNKLDYAVNDAEEFSKLVKNHLGFPKENIKTLINDQATKDEILEAVYSFNNPSILEDDRIIIFFAGHGHTQESHSGDVGFLIPQEGDPSKISSLLPWKQLTDFTDFIKAKHILFIMDCCYSGLGVRKYRSGVMRYAEDSMQRFSRQALAAGKGDQVVDDSGGPRPKNSIFTGHLLNTLEEELEDSDIFTATGLMHKVTEKVATDPNSQQTPHYGPLEGDGDFVFKYYKPPKSKEREGISEENRYEIPPEPERVDSKEEKLSNEDLVENDFIKPVQKNLTETVKTLLGQPNSEIQLEDLVNFELRKFLEGVEDEIFSISRPQFSKEELLVRLAKYEEEVQNLLKISILIGYYGKKDQLRLLDKIIPTISESVKHQSGLSVWLDFQWYPLLLVIWGTGIATIAAKKYENLSILLNSKVRTKFTGVGLKPSVIAIGRTCLEYERQNIFKQIPGHERHYAARSEYLYGYLQPILEDQFLLGSNYENYFDKFEILFALVFADRNFKEDLKNVWGPIGRFGWKNSHSDSPFKELMEEAGNESDNWPILKAGFFNGSIERFLEVSKSFQEDLLNKIHWY